MNTYSGGVLFNVLSPLPQLISEVLITDWTDSFQLMATESHKIPFPAAKTATKISKPDL